MAYREIFFEWSKGKASRGRKATRAHQILRSLNSPVIIYTLVKFSSFAGALHVNVVGIGAEDKLWLDAHHVLPLGEAQIVVLVEVHGAARARVKQAHDSTANPRRFGDTLDNTAKQRAGVVLEERSLQIGLGTVW